MGVDVARQRPVVPHAEVAPVGAPQAEVAPAGVPQAEVARAGAPQVDVPSVGLDEELAPLEVPRALAALALGLGYSRLDRSQAVAHLLRAGTPALLREALGALAREPPTSLLVLARAQGMLEDALVIHTRVALVS